jgi:competence protein ComEC
MRRLVTILVAVLMLSTAAAPVLAQPPAAQQQPQTKEQTVYITKTGKKYHRANCRYLSKSKIVTSLKDATAHGYTPCSVCNPPR